MHSAAKSVRYVRHGVRHGVRHQTRAVAGVCGMCGINAPAHMRENAKPPRARFPSRARKHAAHTAHAAHPSVYAGFRVVPYRTPIRTHTAHPFVHLFFYEKKEVGVVMEEKSGVMRCSEENVAAFNARLRQEAPEAFALLVALHKAGMVEGLRGATIGPAGSLPDHGVVPILSDAAETRLADLHWKRGGRKA